MHCNYSLLLNSIHGIINVPSLYPYFCSLIDHNEYVEVMLRFLDHCKTTDFGPWIWGIEISVQDTSEDPIISAWIREWNYVVGDQKVNELINEVQTLVSANGNGSYILRIHNSIEDVDVVTYRLNKIQVREVLSIMLDASPYNQDYIFVEPII